MARCKKQPKRLDCINRFPAFSQQIAPDKTERGPSWLKKDGPTYGTHPFRCPTFTVLGTLVGITGA
jgi:hypothetical protein